MRLTTLLTSMAFMAFMVLGAIASPVQDVGKPRNPGCLALDDANTIVNRYIAFLGHRNSDLGDANTTAQLLLDDNYTEVSDSVLSLKQSPLGAVTFPNKQGYIAGTLASPAATLIETIEIHVAGCTKILWYWNFHGVGNKANEVKGFNLFTITPALQILTTNLEFNSVAWGLNEGDTFTKPSASASA